MKPKICKLCKAKDDVNGVRVSSFNIQDFQAVYICEVCADRITYQQIGFNLEFKWKTYREMKNKSTRPLDPETGK